jgi:phosphatidylglycerol---prolipoprotein diacylglyceryl transferase
VGQRGHQKQHAGAHHGGDDASEALPADPDARRHLALEDGVDRPQIERDVVLVVRRGLEERFGLYVRTTWLSSPRGREEQDANHRARWESPPEAATVSEAPRERRKTSVLPSENLRTKMARDASEGRGTVSARRRAFDRVAGNEVCSGGRHAPPRTRRDSFFYAALRRRRQAREHRCQESPMIPYVEVGDIRLGPLTLHPFGLLVATGVLVGLHLAEWRARRLGLDAARLRSVASCVLVGGFVGGHMLDEVFYHPASLARPWTLLCLWEGLSSFGGFAGALAGALSWKYLDIAKRPPGSLELPRLTRRAVPLAILPYCDAVMSVFPVAWAFGRSGCSVVHDHPGALASPGAIFAVAYPSQPVSPAPGIHFLCGDAPRYDLGTLELFFAVLLAVLFAVTWRRQVRSGTYIVLAALAYAPVRFALDFLRLPDAEGGDMRYGGLTPAQWGCIVLATFGAIALVKLARRRVADAEPAPCATGDQVGPSPSASRLCSAK